MDGYKYLNQIRDIINTELKNLKLLNGQWHLGKVDTVLSSSKLKVFVDGSVTSQEISCNPDIAFQVNDSVVVVFLNGDSKDKFVISRRIT